MNTKDSATAEKIIDHADVGMSILHQGTCTYVKVTGEIDIATAPTLREGLLAACDHCAGRLVVDLSGVSHCDASALAVLIGTQRRANQRDITLCLAAPSRQVARLLHITGLDRTLPLEPPATH